MIDIKMIALYIANFFNKGPREVDDILTDMEAKAVELRERVKVNTSKVEENEKAAITVQNEAEAEIARLEAKQRNEVKELEEENEALNAASKRAERVAARVEDFVA